MQGSGLLSFNHRNHTLTMAAPEMGSTAGVVAGVIALGKLVDWWVTKHQAKKGEGASAQLKAIDRKIDTNHQEIRRTVELLGMEIREIDKTATEALHIAQTNEKSVDAVGQRVSDVELWQESETRRERDRLQRIVDAALPTSPGITRAPV